MSEEKKEFLCPYGLGFNSVCCQDNCMAYYKTLYTEIQSREKGYCFFVEKGISPVAPK